MQPSIGIIKCSCAKRIFPEVKKEKKGKKRNERKKEKRKLEKEVSYEPITM